MKATKRSQLLAALIALTWAFPASAAKVQFLFEDWAGPPIRVFATRPSGFSQERPVVFVMHGVGRNAGDYRDQWHDLALAHDFLLVVPEFSERHFRGSLRYNLGFVFDPDGEPVDRGRWSFSAIEPLFDEVRQRFSLASERYSLYGHSAGSQFVHRFAFHVPTARVSRIVTANAGWYMMPDFDVDYPYGLRGSAVSGQDLAHALGLPVTVLLGDRDIDENDPNLRRSPEAMAQGRHRLERGRAFFDAGRARASELGVAFGWSVEIVEGADHDNRLMAPAAARLLVGD